MNSSTSGEFDGPVVAILGRPNVGKSTLFNRIVGRRMAIVENIPGVTRDRNYTVCTYQGRRFTLIDTGGLDPTASEGIPQQIKFQTQHAINQADILIVMFDGREGVTGLDEEIVSLLRKVKKKIIYIVNKIDSRKFDPLLNNFYELGVSPLIPVSAEHGIGVDELLEVILPDFPSTEETMETQNGMEEKEIPRIAVVGRPNVGKSTFINGMLRETRLITDEIPGTTRDSIDSLVSHNGRSYLFIDTAGIRRRGRIEKGIERYSISRTLSAIDRCHIAMILMDGGEGVVDLDTKILGHILTSKKGVILMVNKWDLCQGNTEAGTKILSDLNRMFPFVRYVPVIFISALKGLHHPEIFEKIEQVLAGYTSRISTGELNRAFEKALSLHPPPSDKGKSVKLNYITQVKSSPPTFVMFSNRPRSVKASYKKYLENYLREQFGFFGTPLEMIFRQKGPKR